MIIIPGDSRINQKEVEKITKYQDMIESRSRKTLEKEGKSSAGGDWSPGSNTQRPRKTSENLRA